MEINQMRSWTRKTPLDGSQQTQYKEIWEYADGQKTIASFEVEVTIGKPLDVLGLKNSSLQDIRDFAKFLQQTASKIYKPSNKYRQVNFCPCCEFSTIDAFELFSIFDIPYHRCQQCGHVFIRQQPLIEERNELFTESDDIASFYTDMESLETRMQQVIQPKVDWSLQVFQQYWKKPFERVLDVGAGAGHFVEGVRRQGFQAEGYELSNASRRFAKEVFGIDLHGDDFLAATNITQGQFDLITFWGLLEYTPEPSNFIKSSHRLLESKNSMLVVEVPRFDCYSTAIQTQYPHKVSRHLDPTSHVNCFSDASITTVLFNNGYKPVAVWYFGMDVYELLVQLGLESARDDFVKQFAHLIPELQNYLDAAKLCDDIIIAAVPLD